MRPQTDFDTRQAISIEVRGAHEWIVAVGGHTRGLHVYRLAASDWLVSEVGCPSEGRADTLAHALAALAGGRAQPPWWTLAVEALDESLR